MASRRAWRGRLYWTSGRLLYTGPVAPTAPHAHHAFQIALACSGVIRIADGSRRETASAAVIVPPNASHQITQACEAAAMLYIDPDDLVGRRLRRLDIASDTARAWSRAAANLDPLGLRELPASWDEAAALEDAIVALLVGEAVRPRPVHPAVNRTLGAVAEKLDDEIRLADLARHAGLSPGRLSHLFTAQVGIPLRRYILWCRLVRAAGEIRRGRSFTDAAHAAGFVDGAHFNHVCRRMFGLVPSEAMGAVEWVVPPTR